MAEIDPLEALNEAMSSTRIDPETTAIYTGQQPEEQVEEQRKPLPRPTTMIRKIQRTLEKASKAMERRDPEIAQMIYEEAPNIAESLADVSRESKVVRQVVEWIIKNIAVVSLAWSVGRIALRLAVSRGWLPWLEYAEEGQEGEFIPDREVIVTDGDESAKPKPRGGAHVGGASVEVK